MLRDIPEILTTLIIFLFLIIIIGINYETSTKSETVVLTMNEIVRTSAIKNRDDMSRVYPGELFLVKEDFETDVVTKIENSNSKLISESAIYEFDYFDNNSGSTKAVRLNLTDNDKTYQTTVVIEAETE